VNALVKADHTWFEKVLTERERDDVKVVIEVNAR
jgi:hypothetical protein